MNTLKKLVVDERERRLQNQDRIILAKRSTSRFRHARSGRGIGRHALLVVAVALMPLISGCANRSGILGVDYHADIPAGAVPLPAGTSVCDWQTAQVTSAIADQNVLYQADFVDRSSTLSPAARVRLSRNAQTDLAVVQPWIIEPSGDSMLDADRQTTVANELSVRGIQSPDVHVAVPAALGMSAPDAERVAGSLGNSNNANPGTGAPLSQSSSSASTVIGVFQ